jgi:septum formation protein
MFKLTHHLILGSKSPRRQELIQGLGLPYEVRTLDTHESYPESLKPQQIASFLAEIKAKALLDTLESNELLITSDTVVITDSEVLGKPENQEQAKKMIAMLSGKTHQVITGVHLATLAHSYTFDVVTEVTFLPLESWEIDYYVEKFNPLDKAGSYGIQEWIGYIGIEKMHGSYYNVMGLPTAELWKVLKKLGYIQHKC